MGEIKPGRKMRLLCIENPANGDPAQTFSPSIRSPQNPHSTGSNRASDGRDGQVMSLARSLPRPSPSGQPLPPFVNAFPARSSYSTSRLSSRGARARASSPRSNLIMPLPIVDGMGCHGMRWVMDGRGVGARKEVVVSWCVLSLQRIWNPQLAKTACQRSNEPEAQLPPTERLVYKHSSLQQALQLLADQGSCLWSRSASLPSLPRLSLPSAWMSHHLIHPGWAVGCLRFALYVTSSFPIGRFPRRLVPERTPPVPVSYTAIHIPLGIAFTSFLFHFLLCKFQSLESLRSL